MSAFSPAPDLNAQPLRFLNAYWTLWQALAQPVDSALTRQHGLDLRAFIALSYVQGGATSPGELAAAMSIPNYEVSRTLDRLSHLGAITRQSDPANARRRRLSATPSGQVLWTSRADDGAGRDPAAAARAGAAAGRADQLPGTAGRAHGTRRPALSSLAPLLRPTRSNTMTQDPPKQHPTEGTCPFHASTGSDAATSPLTRREDQLSKTGAAIEIDGRGVYRVHSFQAARAVLKDEGVRQAGFMSEMAAKMGGLKQPPVLFSEGETHHSMRRDTARYFTPTSVAGYQPMIAALADDLIGQLAARGEVNLDDLSLKLAVNVAAQVVGLTNSRLPGMERRITAFVDGGGDSEPGAAQLRRRGAALKQQANLALFFALDVKPAIQARKKERRDDLISHLLDKDYNDVEILTECLTYGTAGMVTTREFISAAAWHLLQNPDSERRVPARHRKGAPRHPARDFAPGTGGLDALPPRRAGPHHRRRERAAGQLAGAQRAGSQHRRAGGGRAPAGRLSGPQPAARRSGPGAGLRRRPPPLPRRVSGDQGK